MKKSKKHTDTSLVIFRMTRSLRNVAISAGLLAFAAGKAQEMGLDKHVATVVSEVKRQIRRIKKSK